MKKRKNLLILTAVFILSVFCVTLYACKDTEEQNDTVSVLFKNGETVQTFSADITEFNNSNSIYDFLISEKGKEELNAVINNADTDTAYLQGICGILANNDNYEYIAIYSDIASFTDDTNLTVTVNGIYFYYSNVGIKGLLLQKDAHYLFSLEQWTTQEAVDLNNVKTAAKAELDGYATVGAYRVAEQTTLANAVADGKTAIDNAVDTAAVSTALANAKTKIDGIKTDAELTAEAAAELSTAKINAKKTLDVYVNADDYRTEVQATLATAITNGKKAIDDAVDTAAVSTALANAKSAIDDIKTDAELTAEAAAELSTARTDAKTEIDTYKALPENDVSRFDGFEAAKKSFAVIYGQIDDSIDNATTVSAVDAAVSDAETLIDGMIVNIKCTFTDDGEFLFTKNNDAIADMTVTVPYFDLAEYDLSQFYRYEADSYENGGQYIGDEVLLQPTLMHAFIYMHVMYAENGINDYTVTGSACSSYMSEFWGLDENLNYYVNYKYPLMVIPSVIAVGVLLFKDRKYNIVSVIIAFLACVPFFIGFEKGKTGVRELVVIAVMTALSVVGRLIFAPLPGFKPVTAIVIITAIAFGGQAGFITGAMSALISNIFFGQGPWTPFQMFVWGFIGLLAGLIFKPDKKPNVILLIITGILGGVLFSLLMDIWTTLSVDGEFNFSRYLFFISSGFGFMTVYAVSNVIFLLLLTNPILKKLNRIKIKYGIFLTEETGINR
jgi:uncharacterized membrane protein